MSPLSPRKSRIRLLGRFSPELTVASLVVLCLGLALSNPRVMRAAGFDSQTRHFEAQRIDPTTTGSIETDRNDVEDQKQETTHGLTGVLKDLRGR